VERVAAQYGLPIDPSARVENLSPGLRQRVELVKCLRRNPSVLILDEPTSVLTQAESAELFTVLRSVVRTQSRAVILISHKLSEITAATDRVTVLRRGRVRFHGPTAQTTPAQLAREMVGRDVSLRAEGAALGMITPVEQASADPAQVTGTSGPAGTPVDDGVDPANTRDPGTTFGPAPADRAAALRLSGIEVRGPHGPGLGPIDLQVGAGEIVAVYGVEGNGQTELGQLLAGLVRPVAGTIEVGGAPVAPDRPAALTRAGLGIIPEDRHHCGVVLDLSVADNLMMKALDTDPELTGRGGLLRRSVIRRRARQLIEEFAIATPSPDTPVRRLSGGNQQRVVLARELSARPSVLVAAQPTHGLDVGAIEEMYDRLRAAAADGVGVLLISTELEEVMALASRIAVVSRGRITGELATAQASTERLGLLVGGMAA